MKYIYQQRFGECLNACLSSILDIDYKSIPLFYDLYGQTSYFYIKIDEWLNERGYKRITYGPTSLEEIHQYFNKDNYNIINITFKDHKKWGHTIVSYKGMLFHNPSIDFCHPSTYDYKNCYYYRILKK